ncbi:MAG: ATP-binding protein [Chitinophagales bacterium]|nr:ATP-binding protein [Chitinophagales bacterium]HAE14578.1 ATP-binding protein [Bacteroidota bacterium]MCB9019561.1 ATP-binding protein [Chitinophagales bacterium]MCB9022893.1 ATP-binding protein [Chitinophagales bacterium]HPE97327.1 ATP-binding protein [Chitinophagales bacterium]
MATTEAVVDKELSLPSHPASVVQVESFIEDFRSLHQICDEVYGNMLVAITEAVNNAIIHGNQTDQQKQVTIHLQCRRNLVTCTVQDQGGGFDFNHVPDPTAPENLEKEGGRGIFLMKHLSDLVVFSNDGSQVEIQFRL